MHDHAKGSTAPRSHALRDTAHCLQDAVAHTGALVGLERLVPRITLGSWSAAKPQLRLAAAAIRALTAAVTDCADNANAVLQLEPMKPLVRATSLPANDTAPLCAMRCIQALCVAAPRARHDFVAAGGAAALLALLQRAHGGLVSGQADEVVEAVVRTLAVVSDGVPATQHEVIKGACLRLGCLHGCCVGQSNLRHGNSGVAVWKCPNCSDSLTKTDVC